MVNTGKGKRYLRQKTVPGEKEMCINQMATQAG